MLSVSEARERILAVIVPVDIQTVPLERAAGRILSGDFIAGSDYPHFDNSSVDGFALNRADLNPARALQVVLDIRAGDFSDTPIQPGECARIMTGAPLPPRAEAVIMVEDTDYITNLPGSPAPKMMTIKKAIRPGDNIRRRGEDLHSGEKVLPAGRRLRAQDIGLLATLGATEVSVHRKPRLALLSSGDELLPVEAPLTPGKIHESNSYALAILAKEAGAEVIPLGVAADTEMDIRLRLERAVEAKADLIVSTAGVSVGAFDFIKPVMAKAGELDFWKVNMRPGKPLAFGKYGGIPFIGLPGNPVSAFVGFEIFVKPALDKLSGLEAGSRLPQTATLAEVLESDGRESYLRAIIHQENGRLVAHLSGHQGSGNLLSLVQANALLIVPSGVKSLPASSSVEIWPIA